MESKGGTWGQINVSTWFEDAQDILQSIARNIKHMDDGLEEINGHIIFADKKESLSDNDLNEYFG